MPRFRESFAPLADGQPIYLIEEGNGPPFLYSHGSTGSADSARPIFEHLCQRFHCISLDRAGYRRSGALDRLTTMEEQVDRVGA